MKPLAGVAVVELASIGPGPHAAMLLGDLGASVVRVVRPGQATQLGAGSSTTHVLRNRSAVIEVDLKDPAQRESLLQRVETADVLVEGFRPGVTERLGLGPADCQARNPGLVYARMTGWGQSGPRAPTAGHDINYLSLTGLLDAIGPADHPVPPLNLVGDFGGGSMFLVVGVLAALLARARTGQGAVIDAAMVDGASTLAQFILELKAQGDWAGGRAGNLLDGGAPFYRTYACADGRFVAVGAIEPRFYALLLQGLRLDPAELPDQNDRSGWPALHRAFADRFATRTRDEWARQFDGTDACVTPVLTIEESTADPHVAARGSLGIIDGHVVAGQAPRFA